MQEKIVKPQLHQSHLSMLYKCGEKFRRIVIEGHREPPTTDLVIGTASHKAIAHNLTNKIEKGTLLTREAVQDFSRDSFIREWQSSPIILTDEQVSDGLQKTRDVSQDSTIAIVTEHHYAIAPRLKPIEVEKPWVLEAVGFPYDLAGTWDIYEKYQIVADTMKIITTIRDNKTRSRDFGQIEVDNSEQFTVYAMAAFYIKGVMPDYVFQDTLLKPTTKRPATAISYKSTRTNDDFEVFKRRFEAACRVIDHQAYTPANPTEWWCSKSWCGFAADGSCKFFNSKRGATITKTIVQTGEENGKESRLNAIEGIISLK